MVVGLVCCLFLYCCYCCIAFFFAQLSARRPGPETVKKMRERKTQRVGQRETHIIIALELSTKKKKQKRKKKKTAASLQTRRVSTDSNKKVLEKK